MIIWRGLGILVPIIAILIWALIPELFKEALQETTYSEYYKYISSFSMFLASLAIWFLGRRLNGGEGRVLVDESTGEKVILKANHSLFFINFEFWAIPLFLFFLLTIFNL